MEKCLNCGTAVEVSELLPLTETICPVCSAVFVARRQFDHYQVESILGQGGMGAVYKAFDTHLGRRVALKVLRRDLSENRDLIDHLDAEAKATARVSHPHVVRVFTRGSSQGMYYIVLELINGGSLAELIVKHGRLGEHEVLSIGLQIASGLQATHRTGLIHRDVQPGNILFTEKNEAKIVDFGVAAAQGATDQNSASFWGNPHYLAPEKLDRCEDFRSDIYSLGATLFHALVGRPPFEGANPAETVWKHRNSRVLGIQTYLPTLSNAGAFCINQMLQKNPEQRFQSYDELIGALEFAISLLPPPGGASEAKTRVLIGANDRMLARTAILGLTGLAVVAVCGAFWSIRPMVTGLSVAPSAVSRHERVPSNPESPASLESAHSKPPEIADPVVGIDKVADISSLRRIRDLQYRLFYGFWNRLPDFSKMIAGQTGGLPEGLLTLSVADRKAHYGILFDGKIDITETADYTFSIASDDDSRLVIDDRIVAEYNGLGEPDKIVEARVNLTKGEHRFHFEYFQADMDSKLYLGWRVNGSKIVALSDRAYPSKDAPTVTAAPTTSFDASRFFPVDFQPAATADTRAGLFAIRTAADKTLPFLNFGLIDIEGVPFNVLDASATDRHKNVIILRSTRGDAQLYPNRVSFEFAPIQAKALHFLGGVGAWLHPQSVPGKPLLKVVVTRTDDTTQEIVLKNGVEFCDYVGASDVPGSTRVLGLVARPRQIRTFKKELLPGAPIAGISIEGYNEQEAAVLVAITAELEK